MSISWNFLSYNWVLFEQLSLRWHRSYFVRCQSMNVTAAPLSSFAILLIFWCFIFRWSSWADLSNKEYVILTKMGAAKWRSLFFLREQTRKVFCLQILRPLSIFSNLPSPTLRCLLKCCNIFSASAMSVPCCCYQYPNWLFCYQNAINQYWLSKYSPLLNQNVMLCSKSANKTKAWLIFKLAGIRPAGRLNCCPAGGCFRRCEARDLKSNWPARLLPDAISAPATTQQYRHNLQVLVQHRHGVLKSRDRVQPPV